MVLPKIQLSRKRLRLAAVLVIALSIPVTLTLISVSQELRRRAAPPPVTIRGMAYEDINRNGILNEGEPGLLGVTITLKDQNGNYLSEAMTNDRGYFNFTKLEPTHYNIEETVPDGYKNTTPASVEVNALEGEPEREISFGNRSVPLPGKGRISGYKWNDQNGNGFWDTSEPPYSEGTIMILSGAASMEDSTNEIGYFEFNNLEPGDYTVEALLPPDWRATTPNLVVTTITAGDEKTVNFGQVYTPPNRAKIFGYNFDDINGNGNWDLASEPGIGKAIITLKDSEGTTVSSTETWEGTAQGGSFPGLG